MKKFINYYIMEIVGVFYIAFAVILFLYVDSFTSQERFDVLHNLREYLVLEWGGYLADKKFYSILLNNFLLLFTSVFIFLLYPFHKGRKLPKRRKPYGFSHLFISICGILIASYFIVSDWKFFDSVNREVRISFAAYIIVNCFSYVIFISECWYFIDAVKWVFKFIKYHLGSKKSNVTFELDKSDNNKKGKINIFYNIILFGINLLALYIFIRIFAFKVFGW